MFFVQMSLAQLKYIMFLIYDEIKKNIDFLAYFPKKFFTKQSMLKFPAKVAKSFVFVRRVPGIKDVIVL